MVEDNGRKVRSPGAFRDHSEARCVMSSNPLGKLNRHDFGWRLSENITCDLQVSSRQACTPQTLADTDPFIVDAFDLETRAAGQRLQLITGPNLGNYL